MYQDSSNDVTNLSIVDFLEKHGFKFKPAHGGKLFCSSPFSRDSNWSFCIYPSNTYFDWSTGSGGNIINLASKMYNLSFKDTVEFLKKENKYEKYKPNYKQYKNKTAEGESFDYKKYVNTSAKEIAEIQAYAASRKITEGFIPGIFFTRIGEKWIRNPSIMFLHQNEEGQICGAKFRKIKEQSKDDQSLRFSARGKLGLYTLETMDGLFGKDPQLFFVESESSANSLWEFLKKIKFPAVIVSSGGVSSPPQCPKKWSYLTYRKVIIDYDGNEKLYQERLKMYKHLNAKPIKLILPKGEDINSLYCKDEMYLIEHLLLN